ncbi:hypothetical protein [Roseovarius pacificus]|uniref:hypothetical protein n=1 Tax=Roseovarius pacificus TaxID=337701 RepID=UPI002A18D5E8|nr:hypothetical protein [Roseovarius pacificus]
MTYELSFAWGAKSPLTLDKTLVFLAEAGALLLHVEFMTTQHCPTRRTGLDARRRTI